MIKEIMSGYAIQLTYSEGAKIIIGIAVFVIALIIGLYITTLLLHYKKQEKQFDSAVEIYSKGELTRIKIENSELKKLNKSLNNKLDLARAYQRSIKILSNDVIQGE